MPLVVSSTSSDSDLGSNQIGMSQTDQIKECASRIWYHLFILEKEFPRFLDVFTGKKPLTIIKKDNTKEERTFNFSVFAYTDKDHRERFNNYSYTKKEYEEREDSFNKAKQAFQSDKPEEFNNLIDNSKTSGNGYIFVSGPLKEIQLVLRNLFPRKYLYMDTDTQCPVKIPDKQMQEFIYLYESMPYNIELMQHDINEYKNIKQQNIRITAGAFAGKKGKIMRLHRSHKLVFAFGNMTIAISHIHAFPYEVID